MVIAPWVARHVFSNLTTIILPHCEILLAMLLRLDGTPAQHVKPGPRGGRRHQVRHIRGCVVMEWDPGTLGYINFIIETIFCFVSFGWDRR
jgi:hypothetical protein